MKRIALLAALAAMAIAPATASAASTINVNQEGDGGLTTGAECNTNENCTLRGAIDRANETGGETTIDLPAGTYHLTEGQISIAEGADITIHGAGSATTTVEGNNTDGLFEVEEGAQLHAEGLTFTGGRASIVGGAFEVRQGGALTVARSVVTGNFGGEFGGGIFGESGSSVTVTESTVTKNGAFGGGGIGVVGECDLVIFGAKPKTRRHSLELPAGLGTGLSVSRSTVEGNGAVLGGGILSLPSCFGGPEAKGAGSAAQPLIDTEGATAVSQSTIARNEAYLGGGVAYASFFSSNALVDSTLAANNAYESAGGVADLLGETTLVSDTVADNTLNPPVEEEIQDAKPKLRRLLHAALGRSAEGQGEGEIAPAGTNLAAGSFLPTDGEETRISLRNTIVANTAGKGENCLGIVESLVPGSGHNLDYPSTTLEGASADTCGMSAGDEDLLNEDPKLDPNGLQANGGPTDTIALQATSPAIGKLPLASDCSLAETGPALPNAEGNPVPVDQRGEPRPGIAGDGCDIGAYEYQQPPVKTEAKAEQAKAAPVSTPPAAQVLGVKIASPVCASKRDITIHIQNVKQFGVVKAIVSVDGKARRTLTGHRLTTAINLVGLPKGTFTVSIVAKTRSGQTLHGQRVYHTCHTRLPGHLYLRL